jgi:uncharacterized protein YceK
MIWELFVCLGVTWAGCASVQLHDFPSEDSCYRALAMMVRDGKTTAFCRPKKREEKK